MDGRVRWAFEVVVGFGWGLGDHVVEIRVKLHGYDASDVVMKNWGWWTWLIDINGL